MTEAAEFKILIVEDDDRLYSSMEKEILREASARGLIIQIVRAPVLVEAKRKIKEEVFHVVSTDMNFPFYADEKHARDGAGAHLASYATRRGITTPLVVYSSGEVDETKTTLRDAGVDDLPPIFQKKIGYSHGEWAKAVLDLLPT